MFPEISFLLLLEGSVGAAPPPSQRWDLGRIPGKKGKSRQDTPKFQPWGQGRGPWGGFGLRPQTRPRSLFSLLFHPLPNPPFSLNKNPNCDQKKRKWAQNRAAPAVLRRLFPHSKATPSSGSLFWGGFIVRKYQQLFRLFLPKIPSFKSKPRVGFKNGGG